MRFAAFELDLRSGELRKQGVRVSIQEQPFQVLVMLVQRAGEVVTRGELRNKIWPADTFVDFEDGLNTAIRRIRMALGDSAESPRFIETLPRRGYRFIVPVQPLGDRALRADKPPAQKVLLAVLPFNNLSADPEQEYFSDGMTEEMIAHLGMLSPRSLGVIARTSVMKYRNTNKSITEIGSDLGVDYVLEGSVRRSGERIRISVRLIQVSDQTNLWANAYERALTDVFAVQTEVATSIAESLAMELLAGQIRPSVSASSLAYEYYLKGRYFWNKRTEEALKKGIAYFRRSIEEDSGYAQAYAGLADCYAMLAWNTMLSPSTSLPEAKAAAIKALQLNDRLAEAQASLAFCRLFHEWDWLEAERGFHRAIELNPSYGVARPWYAFELSALGRHDEAVAEVRRALRLDPFSLAIGASAALVLSLAGYHDEAIQQCLKTLEMDPTSFYQTHFVLGASYEVKGLLEQAVRSFQTAVALSNRNPHMLAALGHALATSGRTEEAGQLVDELKQHAREGYVPPFNIAMVYAGLNRKDEAFEWLESAYQDRSIWLIFLNVHPMFNDLRSDPRFESLVRRIGFHAPTAGAGQS
ncbi:MAG TPA: winged helix-turn-helix domain-containing protein [Terriglobia bacterium]